MLLQVAQKVGFAVLDELANADESDFAGSAMATQGDLGDAQVGGGLLLREEGGKLFCSAHVLHFSCVAKEGCVAVTDFVKADMERFSALVGEFRDESDRGCAVLVMCVLEDSLRRLLARVVADEHADLRNIAPPGRLGVAIDNAILFGALSGREAASFKALQKIRNEFAHKALEKLSFTSKPISDWCRDLPYPVTPAKEIVDVDALSNRLKFLMAATMIQVVISVRSDHAKRIPKADDV